MKIETTKRLETILESVEDAPLRDDLRNRFFIVNALEFAKRLHSLDLPDVTKAALLGLKIGLPPSYKGVDLGPLIEKAMTDFWNQLAIDVHGLTL